MEYTTIWGVKENAFKGKFIELGYDKEDGHILLNMNYEYTASVYHFVLKGSVDYNDLLEFLNKYFLGCESFDDARHAFYLLIDADFFYSYVVDYPEPELPQMRTKEEIDEYMAEAHDRVWLVRAKNILYDTASYRANGKTTMQLNRFARCIEEIERVCTKYNINFNEPVSDWNYGYWSGILAALRWVRGDEKDFLDT